ncbi:MAG: hypothetical protein A2749_02020 [Parcubacteria group bacterium RIFCSPHIGHO2_01_FULL_45_26]|nr:MAG: hypothetical protein A2749_02020 [Parcubacteria group bacterium RIFCSPHIGHO2_01_FULL_45_26]
MQLTKTKSYLPPLLLLALMGGVFLIGVGQVWAVGDAYFPQDTDVSMDNGTFTVTAGSDADTVVTTAATVTVTISYGQTFTFKSPNRKQLDVSGTYSSRTCTTSESTVVISPSQGDGQTSVIITPASSNCVDTSAASGSSSTTTSSGGGGTTTVASTPTPTPTPTSSTTPTPTVSSTPVPLSISKPTPISRGFVSLAAVSLKDGDVISASGSSDPDIYIPNVYGYKRLFLNPAIFNFYGHLGGFSKVKKTTSTVRDTLVTSGLFRNCETNDKKVYGVETTGEDTGILHWVNTSGDQAVKDDPNFFKKVFCINSKEFGWYKQGAAYTSVNQIPDYARKTAASAITTPVFTPSPAPASSSIKKYKVFDTSSLNVRSSASTSSAILGKLSEGQIIESLGTSGKWHKIKYQNKDGWVHGDYLKAI